MIYLEFRKKFFDLLCRDSSPDFVGYLRAYEGLPLPPEESFEISCELVNGMRVDNMRLAIMCLHRRDVLRWLSAFRCKVPLSQDFLFENAADNCFGIGLADYPSGSEACRIKLYNTYGDLQSQAGKVEHIQRLFSSLNIPDAAFRRDWEQFRDVEFSGVDWGLEGRASIKVYFGPFSLDQFSGGLSGKLLKEDRLCYDVLRQEGLLPKAMIFCARYFLGGRSLRIDICCKTRKMSSYLRMFDPKGEALRFLVDFYRIFPGLSLQYISIQSVPVQKIKFYFLVGRDL
ncbi:MAG: hypothetical protein Q8Q08_05110 [Candidatus Omnitrophota bacterium]|nr:hypothetical protein [Candidatus Omnitrophota bacterium]